MAESVHDLSDAEIHKRLADARQELFMLRLQRTSGKLTSPAKIAGTRRAVARLLTELRTRELAGSDAGAPAAPAPVHAAAGRRGGRR
jgi:large subunit ribosomal protein L29